MVGGFAGWNLFGPLTITATLTKWFVRKRGWALAIGSIGISLGSIITPVVMTTIVDALGWRNGYIVLATAILAVVIPIAFLMRRTPEDYGLLPDGDSGQTETPAVTTSAGVETRAFTQPEAIRTKAFWLLVLGFGFNQAALASVLVHAIPFATSVDFARTTAALALTVNGLGNLLSKAVWGYGLQHIEPRRLVLMAFSTSACGVGLMLTAAVIWSTPLLFLGFFLYGFGFGGTIPLSEFVWAKYFGRAHIGAIRGMSQLLMVIGAVVGPVLIGLWFDYAQTYRPAFLMIIGVYLSGALLVWISREPKAQL